MAPSLAFCNLLEKDDIVFYKFPKSGLSKKQSVTKLRMNNVFLTGTESYVYLQTVSENEHMQTSAYFLKWHSNKYVVPPLEAMQRMIDIHHNKGIAMLKLECTLKFGCTLPSLAKIFLTKSTCSNF